MKKATVVLICVVLLAGFFALVVYGLRHSRGAPTVVAAEPIRSVLEAPFIDKEIDLTRGSFVEEWSSIPSIELGLMYQVMILPWGKSLIPTISVKAFHNKKDIYFHMSWKDDTGRGDTGISQFTDACAVMFPLGKEIQPSSIMMGFLGKTNIWQWKETQDREYWSGKSPEAGAYTDFHYPFEETETFVVSKDTPLLFSVKEEGQSDLDNGVISKSLRLEFKDNSISLYDDAQVSVEKKSAKWLITDRDRTYMYIVKKEADVSGANRLNIYDTPKSAINDLLATMPGTITPKENQNIQGRGFWENGVWHVTFKRSMTPAVAELGPAFASGVEKFVAFAVWNGANGDRGGRKSISDWVQLKISASPAL